MSQAVTAAYLVTDTLSIYILAYKVCKHITTFRLRSHVYIFKVMVEAENHLLTLVQVAIYPCTLTNLLIFLLYISYYF